MSIRRKVFVLILLLFALLGGADCLIQRFIIFPSFLELEYREAGDNLRRIVYALDREIVFLDKLCHDWAVWDDSYLFMQEQPEEFATSNLNEETLAANRFNLLVFLQPDGTILRKYSVSTERNPIDFPFLQTNNLPLDHLLLRFPADKTEKHQSGILDTPFGPLLFSTQEILHSDGSGPGQGFLIMGRFLDTAILITLKEQTRIPFSLLYPFPADGGRCGAIDQVISYQPDQLGFLEFNSGKYIQTCTSYLDVSGKPIFGIQYFFPREITRKGITSMGYAAALVIASGVIIVILLNLLLQHIILRPVQQLTEHAQRIEQDQDYSRRLHLERGDEIGRLAYSLDTMVETIDQRTSELQLANEQLIILSVQDGLTGIANRRMFDHYLAKEWRRAMREQLPLSLIMLDVDFFKKYNDTYGHQQGDRALIAVAETLQRHIRRPADLAARYGGEEFALILPNTPIDGALLLAECIRAGVEELAMEHRTSEVSPNLSISLGVVTTIPPQRANNQNLNTFVETADHGLYQAKQQGRNKVVKMEFPARPALELDANQ